MHFLHSTMGCSSLCCTNKAIGHQHYNPPTDCKKLLAQDILPQIAHRCTQIRRVWHPCHTHAATKLSSPQNSRNTQKRLAEKKNLCTSVKSVGGSSPPEASVYSVKSVGEYPPPEASVNSVNSVGGLAQTNLEWVLWKEFGGRRGYGRDAIPSYENSHRLHRFSQIRRVWHPCHTHAATKLSSHRIHGTHRNDWRRRKICVHL